MKRSTNRILTTTVGSLARTGDIVRLMRDKSLGRPFDNEAFEMAVKAAVMEAARKQAEIGLDVPSDGEMSKSSFSAYLAERLSGLKVVSTGNTSLERGRNMSGGGPEFSEFMQRYAMIERIQYLPSNVDPEGMNEAPVNERLEVTGRIKYSGQAALHRDLANFKSAMHGLHFEEAFMPSTVPTRQDPDPNHIYPNQRAYQEAVADALREEYKAIVDAGLILQADFGSTQGGGVADPVARARAIEERVEVLNYGLKGIPLDKIRYHHCWGSYNTPHTGDTELKDIIHSMLRINAEAYSIEAANARHEHEWKVWKDVKLPEGKILMPGLIAHTTNVVEHPELVAWRIENFASVVGRENVVASIDCGFGPAWWAPRGHESIQWAKLRSLVEGARLASKTLWGR